MATKRGLRLCLVVVLAQLASGALFGCGGNAQLESSGSSDAPPAESADPPPLGWSIRDTTPYSRIRHATVLDEARDRVIVIGGAGGLDVWALPLSGKNQHRWAQTIPAGDAPAAGFGATGDAVSAVYDSLAQRVLVLRANSYNFDSPQVWQLTLDDTPTWQQLTLEGPDPRAELDQGKVVFDRERNRLLLVGGGLNGSGTWALSLDETARWSRLADAPAPVSFSKQPLPVGISIGALFIDARRDRLVLVTGGVRDESVVWTMPLDGGSWSIESSGSCGADFDASSIYDSTHDRVLFVGGWCGASSYELSTGEWRSQLASNWPSNTGTLATSSIDDAKRGRALFFSGGVLKGNATAALRYDDLELSELVPSTLGVKLGATSAVWDEQRQALVAFGALDESTDVTRSHGLKASERWSDLAGPQPPFSIGFYDAHQRAVIAIGHPYVGATTEVVSRLDSDGQAWETLPVSGGPEVRSWPVVVYDSANQRLVLHGGEVPFGPAGTPKFGDTWALSIDGDLKWTELVTSGNSGGARSRQAAIYDPVGQRMISYGLPDGGSYGPGDLHQLTLDGSLEWSKMRASGTGPARSVVTALYDPQGQRMLVLERTHLYALTLADVPTWHRFCEPGIGEMPGAPLGPVVANGSGTTLLGLAPDGLFAAVGDGTFRFNLDTPYCD